MLPEIPPYELERQIGQGGTATVYLARQPSLSRSVALKVLPPYFAQDEDLVSRFKREATAVAGLRHPNIVQVYDFGRAADWFFLAMEFVQGGSLQERLVAESSLPVPRAVTLIRQVAEGLNHAHDRKIVHRDIKPSNILLTPDDEAVITDFGIVKMLEGSQATRSGSAGIGTAEYMSPEQSQGKPVDARSDLYALGVVFFELITGRLPFTGENPMVTMHRQVYEEAVSPAMFNQAVSPEIADIVLKLIKKDPAKRYASGRELSVALSVWDDRSVGAPLSIDARPTLLRHDTRLVGPRKGGDAPETGDDDPREAVRRERAREQAPVVHERPSVDWRRFLPASGYQTLLVALVLLSLAGAGYGFGRLFLFAGPDEADVKEARAAVQEKTDISSASPGRVEADTTTRTATEPTASSATVPALSELAVKPSPFTLTVGQSAGFVAVGLRTDGETLTPAVDWTVSNDNLAVVGSDGVVTGLAAGQVAVSAVVSHEGQGQLVGAATLTVVAPVAAPITQPRPYRPRPAALAPPLEPEPEPVGPEIELSIGN